MRELSIEEKAKAYDEAIKRVENIKTGKCETTFMFTEGLFEYVFPELKENDDERIRQYLLKLADRCPEDSIDFMGEVKKEDVIAWLEKQGKQPTNKEMKELLRTEYEKGRADAITEIQKPTEFNDFNAKQMFIKALERVEEQNNKGYKLTDCDKNSWWEDFKFYTLCSIMQNHAWSEKYIADVFEKVGLAKIVREQSNDNLTNALQDAMIELSKFIPQSKLAWSEEDEKERKRVVGLLEGWMSTFKETCYAEDCKRGIEWLNSLRPQPKQEWSEEDEYVYNEILKRVADKKLYEHDLEYIYKWLKSLRPQNMWKPSDEQMHYLSWIANIKLGDSVVEQEVSKHLNELLEDLKKLKG